MLTVGPFNRPSLAVPRGTLSFWIYKLCPDIYAQTQCEKAPGTARLHHFWCRQWKIWNGRFPLQTTTRNPTAPPLWLGWRSRVKAQLWWRPGGLQGCHHFESACGNWAQMNVFQSVSRPARPPSYNMAPCSESEKNASKALFRKLMGDVVFSFWLGGQDDTWTPGHSFPRWDDPCCSPHWFVVLMVTKRII